MIEISLANVRGKLEQGGVIIKERIYSPDNKWKQYRLLRSLSITLSDGFKITVPSGFEWDLSSVPRLLWPILPPDGDFEIAALIHDYLYQNNLSTRDYADHEMYIWSKEVNGTRRISIKNVDNFLRYVAVRLFGWTVWE